MVRTISRLRLIFFGVFIVLSIASIAFQFLWLRPMRKCEASGNWWHGPSLSCATVVYIPDITGRYVIRGQESKAPAAPPTPGQAPAAAGS